MWHPAHKDCADLQTRDTAHICQTLDANCNDCKHFERGKVATRCLAPNMEFQFLPLQIKPFSKNLPAGAPIDPLTIFDKLHIAGDRGFCHKHKATVLAQVNFAANMPCFEHRKGNKYV